MAKQDLLDIKQLVREVSIISSIYLFLFGAGVFIYQIVSWVQNKHWKQVSILDGLEYIDGPPLVDQLDWFYAPDSWIQVHRLLSQFSLSLTFFLLSGLLWYLNRRTST